MDISISTEKNLDGLPCSLSVKKRNGLEETQYWCRGWEMQKDYNGYLVAFGTYQLPNSFLVRYVSTPNQRIEKKAWRDNTEYLQRVTSKNYKTTLKLEIRPLTQGEKDLFESIKSNGLLNLDQRKYSAKYWNLETGLYSEGEFYVPDIEYAINHISDNESGEMHYEAFTLEMIQY